MVGRTRLITVIFTLALLIVVAVSALSYRSIAQLVEDAGWVAHSHEALTGIQTVLTTMVDAETGLRGFLLTGQEDYLKPYNLAVENIKTDVDRLRQLVADDPDQQKRMDTLELLVTRRLNLIQQALDARLSGGLDAAARIALAQQGRQTMEDIRVTIDAMSQAEYALLAERNQATTSRAQTTNVVLLSSGILSITLLVFAFVSLRQEITWRAQAEEALRKSHDELEARVQKRTADLANANRALEDEIAERKRAEQLAHEQREQLQVTLTSIGDGVIATDTAGLITFMNTVAETLTGWQQAEAVHQPIQTVFNIVNEETREPVENPVARVLQQGHIFGMANQTVLIARDGTERPIDESGAPIRDAQGKTIGTILVFHDITERHRTEGALRFLLDASAVLSLSLDLTTTIENLGKLLMPRLADNYMIDLFEEDGSLRRVAMGATNPASEVALRELTRRYPPVPERYLNAPELQAGNPVLVKEVTPDMPRPVTDDEQYLALVNQIGTRSFIIFPLLVRDRWIGALSIGMAESGRRYTEEDLPTVDLLARRVAVAIDNVRLHHALQLSAIRTATLQEITAALSRALTPAQVAEVIVNRSVAALNASAGALLLINDGNRFEIVHMVGEPQGVLEPGFQFSLDPAWPNGDAVNTGIPIWLESDEERIARYPLAAQHAQHYPGSWAILPLIIDRLAIGCLNITFKTLRRFSEDEKNFMLALAQQCAQALERARLYSEVQASAETLAQKVAERTKELQAALIRVRHADQMKSSMISTVSHEMRTPLSSIIGFSNLILSRKPEPQKQLDFVSYINAEARRLSNLVNDFLDIQRIESGREILRYADVDLAELVRDVVDKQQLEGGIHAIRLALDEVPPVYVDASRIRQVILNLLSNATKYSPNGGEIVLSLREEQGEAIFSIRDQGLGIPPEELATLFEHFHRGKAAEVYRIPGTGLGLALCRDLIEMHKGRIWAESAGKGQGATFSFALPLSPYPAMTASASDATPDGKLIAIVEDDAAYATYLAERLKHEGYATRILNFQDATPETITQATPSLIMLDVLQGQDRPGWSLLSRLKRHEATQMIPVLVCSATSDSERARELGAASFIPKPVDETLLVAELARLSATPARQILIVDDSDTARTLLRETLAVAGYAVRVAEDGRAAIEQLTNRGWPDLIVLDLMMPDVDGFKVLEWIRVERGNVTIPVIAFTARELTAYEELSVKARATAIAVKSHTSPQQLIDLVNRVLAAARRTS
jgi:PAS domain S-box-containing protein